MTKLKFVRYQYEVIISNRRPVINSECKMYENVQLHTTFGTFNEHHLTAFRQELLRAGLIK